MASVTTCEVTGQLVGSSGRFLSNGEIRFVPTTAIKGDQGVTIIPETVSVVTDENASFSAMLVPDRYSVTYAENGHVKAAAFDIDVPPYPYANLENIRVGGKPLAVILRGGDSLVAPDFDLVAGGA